MVILKFQGAVEDKEDAIIGSFTRMLYFDDSGSVVWRKKLSLKD